MDLIPRIDIHNHTRYSNLRLRDALATPEQLIDKAISLGLKGISISDHECISGHIKANQYAQKIKEECPDFKVILGDEIYLVDERPCDEHYHYVLTAKDKEGYHQLKELSSIAWLYSYSSKGMTRVDTLKSDLERVIKKNPGHLIGSSACLGGEMAKSILELDKAEKICDTTSAEFYHNKIVDFILWNLSLFKDDFYLEVQPGISKEQIIMNKRMRSIAKCFNIKMIPTSDTHYLRPENRYVHKAFLNSENKEREVDAFYQDAYLHTNEEMIEKFEKSGYEKEFVEQMFKNSMEIYDKVEDFSLFHTQQVPKIDVEEFPIQEPPQDLKEYSQLSKMFYSKDKIDRYWINTCINKLKEINKYNKEYLDELEEEAEVKTIVGKKLDTNMFSYPVCLAHYINMIWECGSSVGIGRGSACAALNHYLLGITQLDPLQWSFPFFRYMNRETDGLGDIDIDLAPSKIKHIVAEISKERSKNFSNDFIVEDKKIRELLGATYVCTFGTETSKSSVLTSARGYRSEEFPDGIDVDTSQYLSSLIPSERGFVWSIHDVVYGNEDKDRKPVAAFVNEVNKYPGLLEIMLGIEGCISRRGRHASGVIFNNEDPFEFNAYMKTPSGEIVTQFDLHDAEWAGSVKMDLLVTEVQDKLIQTLKFLQEDNEIEKDLSLREIYDKYIHPDILPIENSKETWKSIQEASVLDLFQLDSDIGRQGAKKVKPDNMIELSSTNGLIRLMPTDKNAETWMDKYVRFKKHPEMLKKEYYKYNLNNEEIDTLNKYLKETNGIGISQEQVMRVLMDSNICGFSLKEANAARKVISKKKMKEIPTLKEKIFNTVSSSNLGQYIWDNVVGPGLGYSFSDIHSLSYSFIGFQTAYLATHWNPLYWDTACLVVNSGSLEEEDNENTKEKGTDYGKIAKALGNIISNNIKVSLIDINNSDYGFKPDIKNNKILFGMKALNGIGGQIIDTIIQNRPYKSFYDFINKVKLNKTAMISLIKSGAFDTFENDWAKDLNIEPRILIMSLYLSKVSEPKNKITLQNFNGLIQRNLIPFSLKLQKETFLFNKVLKTNKYKEYYIIPKENENFYLNNFNIEELIINNNNYFILQKTWDKIYKKEMDIARNWIKENQQQILKDFNYFLFKEAWNKYANSTISAWEMESLCFYYHKHELQDVNIKKYNLANFFNLLENPEIDYYFNRGNHQIPIYKLYRIAGTVIGKNDTRSSISLLTTEGVVNVKFTRDYFAMFNKQISEKREDGTKKVLEKGWFTRGTKLMVTGFRREDTFVGKTYKSTNTHQLYKILKVESNGDIVLEHEREKGQEDEI